MFWWALIGNAHCLHLLDLIQRTIIRNIVQSNLNVNAGAGAQVLGVVSLLFILCRSDSKNEDKTRHFHDVTAAVGLADATFMLS